MDHGPLRMAIFMSLVRKAALTFGANDYEARIGIECETGDPMRIYSVDTFHQPYDGTSFPITPYSHVEVTVDGGASNDEFIEQVKSLALDCVNQGGAERLHLL